MSYAIVIAISLAVGFFACWIYKNKALSTISKERDELKAIAQKVESKL